MKAKSKRPGRSGITRSASPATTFTRRSRPAPATFARTRPTRKGFASTQVSRPRGGIEPAIRIAGSMPPRGRLTCVEANPFLVGLVRANVAEAGLDRRVKVVAGDALRVIPLLPGRFDFAFIDAAKEDYLDYLRQLEPKLVSGAVVVADNTGIARREVAPYLEYVRSEDGRYDSHGYDVDDD